MADADEEIRQAEGSGERVVLMSKDQFREWIVKQRVNMITSDLYVLDEGTILDVSGESVEALKYVLGVGLEDIIECQVSLSDVLTLTDHNLYWFDPIVKA